MIYNYTSLNSVIERVDRIQLFRDNYNPEELKEWTVEALLKIGVNSNMDHISELIEVKDGKACIPDNLERIDSILEGEAGYPMEEIPANEDYIDLSYKINNGYIFTSFEEGSLIINYYGLLIDEENKPLIPDNQYFLAAIEAYLKFKIGDKLYWMRKIVIGEKSMLEQEWLYYCNSARSVTRQMTNDRLENFKRGYLTMLPRINRRGTRRLTDKDDYDLVNRTTLKA